MRSGATQIHITAIFQVATCVLLQMPLSLRTQPSLFHIWSTSKCKAGVLVSCVSLNARLREVVGDEVGAFEEQEYITEVVTLQGAVQSDPVGVLENTDTYVCRFML